MRDVKRIWRITQKLFEIWCIVPDQRFGQLLENYLYPAKIINHKAVSVVDWHMEDDEFEKRLDKAQRLLISKLKEVKK